jgi:uncharacterized membrane protein
MSELRQLLRFEIPGLILLIELIATVICFVNLSKIPNYELLIKNFGNLIIAFPVLALPVGWVVYQIYDAIYKPHYKKKSISILKDSIKLNLPRGERAGKESYHEELLDFVIYNGKWNKVASPFGTYWDNHNARYVIGFYIVIIWFLVSLAVVFVVYYDNYFFSPFHSIFRLMILGFIIIYNVLSYLFIFCPHNRILDEIDARELFLITLHQDIIEKINNNSDLKKRFDP